MKKTFAVLLVLTIALGLVWFGCDMEPTRVTEPATEIEQAAKPAVVGIERAIAVQNQHTPGLMAIPDVVGTAVGLRADGIPAVVVFTEAPGLAGIPRNLDGVPVVVRVTGKITALPKPEKPGKPDKPDDVEIDPKARFDRPVPIGVSTGHPDITAGTIGARVTDGNNVYALSNNHVYADENNASIDDNVLQPGAYDGGTDPDDAIGTLADFETIEFDGSDNVIDAAIALSTTDLLGNATPSDGYGTPKTETFAASIGLKVKKYGRTTSLTKGRVSAINATVDVSYDSGVARFVNQIIIEPGGFSAGGDSGSLIVIDGIGRNKKDDRKPVGLLFAGSSFITVANPVEAVLDNFGVTIDGD